MSFKDKLKELIDGSKLTPDQKELWNLFIMKANPYEDEAVYEAANQGEECLVLLTNNLRDKIMAMHRNDQDAWNRIIEEEEEYLKGLE